MTHNKARRRHRLALWSAPAALIALAVAAKLLSVGVLGGAAAESFATGQSDGVGRAAAWLGVANVLEPHKALFASGDAHVLGGDFAAAREDFEASLRAGAGDDECKVRVNLVLSIEKLGDAAADAAAARLFREALSAAGAAPGRCHEAGPANQTGEGAALDSAAKRLEAKITEKDKQQSDAQQPSPETPSAPQQQQLKQLEESAQQAQQERNEGQQRGEYLRTPDNGPGIDKPW
ncbi:hypothetical protein SAMN04487917_11030 [Arthrobacter sp. yr096]|uniref:hypothetical protein n=1 Tax=Arthrobacter sp. yr096 TaxID=1761750 RepID=UPI0008D73B4A|nr:hypothetical protein [Arthrobacter sp. yr096]SEJ69555.1 hypothetical protein SAMN04487917_11030 [Arthrobacter sp. yr096]